jgi:alpha-ketoglutaric semialdehyde dehydrogenase
VLDTPADEGLMRAMELDYRVVDSGCCALAGNFGFEQGHYAVSIDCAERIMAPAIRAASEDVLISGERVQLPDADPTHYRPAGPPPGGGASDGAPGSPPSCRRAGRRQRTKGRSDVTVEPGRHFIGGEWVDPVGGGTFTTTDPSDTRTTVARYAEGDVSDVDRAVSTAASAIRAWGDLPLSRREAILFDAAGALESRHREVATLISREMGKPLKESVGEVRRSAQIFRFFAGELRRPIGEMFQPELSRSLLWTAREPIGVVGLITPWNFPVAIPAWKLAPAIAYGNAVVIKPASQAPAAVLALADILSEAGLPPGVVNVVTGSGSGVGAPLSEHPDIDAVSFTGSNDVGVRIRAAGGRDGRRVQLELGGQNPAVVFADADLEQAAAAIASGAFGATGQKCTATRRAIVDRTVSDELVGLVAELAEELRVGNPFDAETQLGPLVSDSAVQDYLAAVDRAASEGATVVSGGSKLTGNGLDRGNFVEPTVVTDVAAGSQLATEEVFAPILGVLQVNDEDEAIARANEVRHGLSSAVFTRDLGRATRFARHIRSGVVHVNSQTAGAEAHVPFGGTKASGFGPHEQGRAAIEFYTEVKTVYWDPV